ncbi:MAG: NYN domain-containing protein [Minisyncoccota bacterium]
MENKYAKIILWTNLIFISMVTTFIEVPKNLVLKLIIKNLEDGYAKNIIQYNVYIFIGLVPERVAFYEHLQSCGYILVFKQTVSVGEKIKGNCDAELVLKTASDFYTNSFTSCMLITGDGDFGCLVEFLRDKKVIHGVLAPDEKKCSILIRNKNIEITFLNDHYHKFSRKI